MTARCVKCSRMHHFANTRGAKLSERECDCGGKLEIIYSATVYDIDDPLNIAETAYNEYKGRKYVHARWSKSGLFVYDRINKIYVPLKGEFIPDDENYPKERKFKPKYIAAVIIQ